MWKVQTGEQVPLWCMLLVFTQSYGKLFMSPIIVHQYKEYSKDLNFNIPLYWTVHQKSSGYMDRDVWLKSTTQFFNLCGTSAFNNQTISSMEITATLMTLHLYIKSTKTPNP